MAEIRPVVFGTTGHVSKSTAQWLDEQGCDAADHNSPEIHIASHVYGWFIYCDEESEDMRGAWPDDLIDVMKRGRELGCDYVCLDRDGEAIEGLPTYDW